MVGGTSRILIKARRVQPWTIGRVAAALLLGAPAIGLTAALVAPPLAHAPKPAASASASTRRIRDVLDSGLTALDADLSALATSTAAHRSSDFRRARRDYKRIEGLVAYYAPPVAAALNAPVAEETGDEATSGKRDARGFQLLEPMVFPRIDRAAWTSGAAAEIVRMREAVQGLRKGFAFVTPTDVQLLDAARLEIGRVSTLGIAGFDAMVSGDGIVESAAALDGVEAIVPMHTGGAAVAELERRLVATAAYLRAHPDFDTFDRFQFVAGYANPAFDALFAFRRSLALTDPAMRRTWPATAPSIYDAAAFDSRSYGPTDALMATPAVLAIGRDLFFDPILSGDGQRACASCHRPDRAFTDGRARARPFGAVPGAATRHTPSIINAGFQPAQFADERAASLEDQVATVLASRQEMGSSVEAAAHRLNSSTAYRERIARALGRPARDSIAPRSVQLLLAIYVRSLSAFGAPFDRALRGDTVLVSAGARRGFSIFMGKARCGTCHFAPLFNGTAPPEFVTSEVEVVGVPSRAVVAHATLDADDGRRAIDHLDGHAHAFKTPTVRNALLTAPYMHNGAYRTFDDVLDFYEHGGGTGIGAVVPNQTLDGRPLHLTPRDRRDLTAFIASLTDTTGLTARPLQLPPLDASLRTSARAVGGTY